MAKKRILVVDDDSLSRSSIVEILRRRDYEVTEAANGPEALQLFRCDPFDMVISDMKMPGMSGIQLLENIRHIDTEVPFLIITAYGAVDSAVEAVKKGADHYIQKTENLLADLELQVERLLEYKSVLAENKRLKSALHEQWNYVGSTSAMEQIRALVKKVAESRSTILISGESGTGKELVARSIHYQSPRSHAPFIKVNCAALPEGLIESELFGHEKGAFTGAVKQKMGKFELASGGTLLLDEIGEMPVAVQAKLLRVLQEREISKVGSESAVEIDVRVVATTNRDLYREVEQGRFREDLLYRLDVFHVRLPPLRERKSDIEKLVEHFIRKYNDENGFSVEGLGAGCLDHLMRHDWPGNIRELQNTIERAIVLTRNGFITPDVLAFNSSLRERAAERLVLRAGATVAEMERDLIMTTLEHCDRNRTKAAQMLGISVRTLRNKLNEYSGITEPDIDEP